jgi:outer membrane receptor protein involved in Fe transport
MLVLLVTLLSAPISVFGQATTGSISGRVVSSDRQPLPGVIVAVTSPMLQGVRMTITSDSGDYLIPLLPPGSYTVALELSGFQRAQRIQQVTSTHNAPVDVTLSLAALNEAVTVVADARPLSHTAQVATNFKQDLMATLPSNRTIDAVLLMSPSVHATGPRGAFSIDGALSYENLFLLNGGVINENVRGSAYPLYIEDALQEVTVATAGVSAEYGRFTGGLITAITKSGGNTFSGSLRTSFANDYWRSKTPASNDPKRDALAAHPGTIPTYEGTLGGPVIKERLWFFGATRIREEQTARSTAFTGISYIRTNDEKRYEGKLTFTPRANHSLQSSYTAIDQVQTNFTSQVVMDMASLGVQKQPSNLLSLRYSGIVSPNLAVELQYSSRHLSLNTGATTRDRIGGTLLTDGSRNARYWSPTFCSVCGDEKRDNDNVLAKVSYFLSTRSFGAHHLMSGYDRFNDKIFQNAYASGSDYRIQGTSSILVGTSVFPQFLPVSTLIMHTPVDKSTLGSDLRMHSVFFNDGWRLNNHLSFNLGVRWDKNQAQDGGGAVVANTGLLSPRVAVVWDPQGTGRWALNASYARYVMPMMSNVAASTTAAGNASTLVWPYLGPAINSDQNAPALVTSAEAIERVFQWFEDNGGAEKLAKAGSFLPGVNVRIDSPLKSPNTDEYAVGTSRQIGTRGTLRVDGVWRTYHDFYSQRADMATKTTTDALKNTYDLFLVENTNNVKRRYSGLSMQASYRITAGLDVGGNYTLSRTWGNFDGETAGSGPSVAQVDAFPEYKRADWNSPEGDLAADQRHRARAWGTYVVPMPRRAGSLTFGLLQQMGSGVPYGAVAPLSASSFGVTNPGYVSPAAPGGTIDYYFTDRDAFRTATSYRTDLSVNYGHRLRAGNAQPELFFHGEVLNLFNQFQLCGCGGSAFSNGGSTDISTIRTAVRTPRTTAAGTYQTFNPFTTAPVRGTHWDLSTAPGSDFGGAVSHLAYTTPRLFRFSVGIRF